ncbi:MAG TPA: DUF362 domain-containing protein [Vicinamibacteria bacterium]|nr:DUF362 domain-containing protein [Vicinamibacteria bacterium]
MTRAGMCAAPALSRRQFLAGSTAVVGLGVGRLVPFVRAAPSATVSVAKCDTYGAELLPTLDRMFDQLGGLGRLVNGRTVAIKLNLTGPPTIRLGRRPAGLAHWVHPTVIGAVVHLMDQAGAQRVRLLESGYASAIPLDEYMYQAGWDAREIVGAGRRVELENTNWLGGGREYHRFDVPGGGLLFPSYHLNHSYRNCDVFVSLTKLKDHTTAGVTLSMKNCFGNIPTTIYGDHTAKDAPDELPHSGRNRVFHDGARQPTSLAAPEKDPASPRHEGYRIPRVVVDICAARPIDLAIIDGIDSMGGTEGPWSGGEGCHPGVLVAGTNCVNTDAVAAAVMGYDPMARAGESPFNGCDNFLELAEGVGLGTRDLKRIEVAGTPIREARFDFAPMIRSRFPSRLPPYPGKKP